MSATQHDDDTEGSTDELDADALRTQLAVVKEENERLREEYARARQTSYRRTALALVGVGLAAVVAGVVLTNVREVLLVIGAIGVFGGVLTWYLTPERVLTVGIAESIYTSHAANGRQLRDELGLQDTHVYVPSQAGVWLFLPAHREFALPDDLTGGFQLPDETRGVALTPAGRTLYDEFDAAAQLTSADSRRETATQLGDAVVEQFEIADAVSIDESSDGDRIVVAIDDVAFGSVTDFDHPVVSVLACGLADTHNEAIVAERIDDTTVAFDFDRPHHPGDEATPSEKSN